MKTKKIFKILLSGGFFIAGFCLSLNALLADWSNPISTPPNGNVLRPIHIGFEPQVKAGSFGVADDLVVGEFVGWTSLYVDSVNRRVGFRAEPSSFADNESSLTLEVGGKLGAAEYCDENGNNCLTIGQILSGGTNYSLSAQPPGSKQDVVHIYPDGDIRLGLAAGDAAAQAEIYSLVDHYNSSEAKQNTFVLGDATLTLTGNSPSIYMMNPDSNKYDYYIRNSSEWMGIFGDTGSGFDRMIWFSIKNGHNMIGFHTEFVKFEDTSPEFHFMHNVSGTSRAYWEIGITEESATGATYDGRHFFVRGDDGTITADPAADKTWIVIDGPRKAMAVNKEDVTCATCHLDVNGRAKANSWNITSDIREKKNIKAIKNALEKVLSMNGVYFNWNNPEMDQDRQVGLIAQEVEKTIPELVTEAGSDGNKSLYYDQISALLIEALKEYSQKNNAELSELEAENELLLSYACKLKPTAEICR